MTTGFDKEQLFAVFPMGQLVDPGVFKFNYDDNLLKSVSVWDFKSKEQCDILSSMIEQFKHIPADADHNLICQRAAVLVLINGNHRELGFRDLDPECTKWPIVRGRVVRAADAPTLMSFARQSNKFDSQHSPNSPIVHLLSAGDFLVTRCNTASQESFLSEIVHADCKLRRKMHEWIQIASIQNETEKVDAIGRAYVEIEVRKMWRFFFSPFVYYLLTTLLSSSVCWCAFNPTGSFSSLFLCDVCSCA